MAAALPFVGLPLISGADGNARADHDPAVAIMLSREPEMLSSTFRSSFVLAVILAAGAANTVSAQSVSSQTSPDKARCNQLISYFDRYGASRGENSDGERNHTRIGARIDCDNGHPAEAVATMEKLLTQKNMEVPPAPTGLAQPSSPAGTKLQR
ncbi:MAG: hypothetical protein J0H97_22320 [Alphaproteobacteria bacterium]|jgi:hypothetical protein|nr:hypothetical protein [Alphaproteobacteria bacterium]